MTGDWIQRSFIEENLREDYYTAVDSFIKFIKERKSYSSL